MSRNATGADLMPIDRLEEKVRLLVGMLDSLRADRAKAQDEIARLTRDLDAAKARLGDAEGASAEVSTLRAERELIRTRVVEMIAHIEKLNV
jgi:chromosome segregation ATPase